MRRPLPVFGSIALICAVMLVVGSGLYWAFALTFGLISGLVVLMAPLYPLLLQAVFTSLVASLCLWRGRPALALALGAPVVVVPPLGVVGWYGSELYACWAAAESEACFAYLNGSPLLPLGVGACVLAAGMELAALVAMVAFAKPMLAEAPAASSAG